MSFDEIDQDITEAVACSLSDTLVDAWIEWLETDGRKGYSLQDITFSISYACAGLLFSALAPLRPDLKLVHDIMQGIEALIVERLEDFTS